MFVFIKPFRGERALITYMDQAPPITNVQYISQSEIICSFHIHTQVVKLNQMTRVREEKSQECSYVKSQECSDVKSHSRVAIFINKLNVNKIMNFKCYNNNINN